MRIQYYDHVTLSSCWHDANERSAEFIERASSYLQKSEYEIGIMLSNGEELYYAPGWDNKLRAHKEDIAQQESSSARPPQSHLRLWSLHM
jgi:hypothetical protein